MSSKAQHPLCTGEGSRESSCVSSFSCLGHFVISSSHICFWLCCCWVKPISLSHGCRLSVTKLHLYLKHKGKGKTWNCTIAFPCFLVEQHSYTASLIPEEAMRNPAEKPKTKYSNIPVAPYLTCLSTYLKDQQTYDSFWMRSAWPSRGTYNFLQFSRKYHSTSHGNQGQECEITWLFL